jgi:STE24 endopeptidase
MFGITGELIFMRRSLFVMFIIPVALCILTRLSYGVTVDPAPANRMPSAITVPPEARPGPSFNVETATRAYLAQIPASAKARSDAYFEGGYWLILWDFLSGVAIALILLNTRLSAIMRNFTERLTRFRFLQAFLYFALYTVVVYALTFPLTVYEGFFREHRYGLATQNFAGWIGDEGKSILLNILLVGMAVAALFAVVRRLQKTWWIWGSVITVVLIVIGFTLWPVFIEPVFNKPKVLDNPKIAAPIVGLARAQSVPAHDVYEIDASRQTTRISAHVSGLGRTMRITLNDNLIRRGSPEEIQAIMGHEIGHYVLHHILNSIPVYIIGIVALFAGLRWSLNWSLARWGGRWQIRGITDPAVLPLVALYISIFFFALTPVMKTMDRIQEREADIFGINASRQPDGMAQAAIHLGEYRKMDPGYWEEVFFYDHPSGRSRIHAAMQWKAENLGLYATPGSPKALCCD